ncbi:hypothetical protein D4764_08G0003310, partial [Takifugu flavidus]
MQAKTVGLSDIVVVDKHWKTVVVIDVEEGTREAGEVPRAEGGDGENVGHEGNSGPSAKFRRETQRTGGTADIKSLSELDQRLGAIIGETALSGVPSAECLDTDLGHEATLSPPPCASSAPEESEVPQSQPVEGQTDPSCSNTRPRSLASPRLISDAVLNNQERMASTLDKIASTLMTIANTLKEINECKEI